MYYKKRYVLDTSVIASSLRSKRGASYALLLFAQERSFTLLASPPLFLEYEDVLLRPEQRLAHGLSIARVNGFLAELALLIEQVQIHYQWRPQVTDPGDEMVLEAAVNGRADALVTHNIRHFASAASRFQLSVLTPQQALKEVAR
jgi:putative PIN family toxin of toxin-antitoxin system